jgi:predicted nuclease of predicted toxin-antitoxin system
MRFKLDENLSLSCAEPLLEAGHDVTTVVEQGLCSAPDHQLISVCKSEGRCLVTLDLDFSNPLVFNPSEYPGIAVLRLQSRGALRDLIEIVQTLRDTLGKESIDGKLWSVQKGRVRIYQG